MITDLQRTTAAQQSTTSVRDVTFDLLRAYGLTTIFGNPGSTELAFLENFPSDFRYVLGLQETSVIAMADGFAQATRRPALVNLHTGVGLGERDGKPAQSIWSAAQLRLPMLIVIMRNEEYAILKSFAVLEHTPGVPGLDLPGLDLVSIAKGVRLRCRPSRRSSCARGGRRECVDQARSHGSRDSDLSAGAAADLRRPSKHDGHGLHDSCRNVTV